MKVMKDFFLKIHVQYAGNLHNLHKDLPSLLERMKIDKSEKLVANLHDKTDYVIHRRNSKGALKHGLVLKNCIGFNR